MRKRWFFDGLLIKVFFDIWRHYCILHTIINIEIGLERPADPLLQIIMIIRRHTLIHITYTSKIEFEKNTVLQQNIQIIYINTFNYPSLITKSIEFPFNHTMNLHSLCASIINICGHYWAESIACIHWETVILF